MIKKKKVKLKKEKESPYYFVGIQYAKNKPDHMKQVEALETLKVKEDQSLGHVARRLIAYALHKLELEKENED